jgi:ATP-dependent exoDNAse (exonuclease V) beta subunit
VKNDYISETSKPAREALGIIQAKGWTAEDFAYGKNSGLATFFKAFAFEKNLSQGKAPSERIRTYFSQPANWPNKKSVHSKDIIQAAHQALVPCLVTILETYDLKFKRALSAEVALKNMYVFGLITDISRKLKEYKDENNLMLLADAPKFLNGVIRDSDTPFIYEKVGSFYRNYLIDEFQDTSGLQWQNFQPLIVNSLDQGYASLVVGDVKQAIYRWRGGDLSLLQDKIIDLIGEERVDKQELAKNFRSARQLVEFNNALFKTASEVIAAESGMPFSLLAYQDVAQETHKLHTGFVEVQAIQDDVASPDDPATVAQTWKEIALERLPSTLERLQESGAALKDIAILVRKNDEGQKIATYLLQYKNSPKAKPNCGYDVVSNESLRIDGAASVNLILGAMRYLLNADDSIARAQLGYEFSRLHEPARELSEVFAVSNQNIFENNLPPQFTRQKPALKKLPLLELTETLISIFGLGTISGELVYLQAFQDLVLDFSNRERNDLAAFLEWWETNRHKKSIQISGEVNAVQILTIHKSKGLQFKYVIIPFCSWSLDHESWQAPNLWVRSGLTPFEDAGYLPVKYSKTLEETFFADYYTEERTRTFLDNLNLLYVAFTRAEFGLIVSAPAMEVRGTKGSIAGLLHNSIQQNESLKARWNEVELTWKSGSWIPEVDDTKKPATSSLQLKEYLSSAWTDKLVIRQSGASFFQDAADEQRQKINHGIYMHAVLSRMHYADEVGTMLDAILHEGLISESERSPLEFQLKDLLKNPRIAHWFSRDWVVRTEVPILLPGGEENRIDRLLVKDRSVIVVDFKTGGRKKTDEKQVLQYIEILRQMNYADVGGYLLYLRDVEIVEVKAGTKPRLVQKAKHKDQLDLGL